METGLRNRTFLSRRLRYDLLLGMERSFHMRVAPDFRIVESESGVFRIDYRDVLPYWRPLRTMWSDAISTQTRDEAKALVDACRAEFSAANARSDQEAREHVRSRIPLRFRRMIPDEPLLDAVEHNELYAVDYDWHWGPMRAKALVWTPFYRILRKAKDYEIQTRSAIGPWRYLRYETWARIGEQHKAEAEGLVALSVANYVEAKALYPEEVREMRIRRNHPRGRPSGYPKRIMLPHEVEVGA